jgi:ferredoxin
MFLTEKDATKREDEKTPSPSSAVQKEQTNRFDPPPPLRWGGQKYEDPYYKAQREKTVIVGVGCNVPCPSCFCTTVESGPFGRSGMDALLTDLGDAYLVRVITPKGAALFEGLNDASEPQEIEAKAIQQKALKLIDPAFETKGLKAKLDNNFESPLWQKFADSCLGCGICTFLCPTCFCFDIVDEAQRSERVRNWDTCMFRTYSLEASQHNPRPSRRERTRQRVMHKFSYWLEHVNKIGCTGCGRCVRYCPVGLDLRAMLREFNALESEVAHG